jgi:hypothetical protein
MHSVPARGPVVRTRPDASAASAAEARLKWGAYVPCSDEHLDCFPAERCTLHDSECQMKVNAIFRRLIKRALETKKRRMQMEQRRGSVRNYTVPRWKCSRVRHAAQKVVSLDPSVPPAEPERRSSPASGYESPAPDALFGAENCPASKPSAVALASAAPALDALHRQREGSRLPRRSGVRRLIDRRVALLRHKLRALPVGDQGTPSYSFTVTFVGYALPAGFHCVRINGAFTTFTSHSTSQYSLCESRRTYAPT